MDATLDTGPILAQARVAVREGIDEAALERDLAERGARLMVRVVEELGAGTAVEQPQDESLATRFGWPTVADYEISPDWPARRAYIFAAGIRSREQPTAVRLADQLFAVVEPLDYNANATLGVPWQLDGNVLRLQCSPGVFRARVAPLA
jgi:methionyl-tRNA formyltransferase